MKIIKQLMLVLIILVLHSFTVIAECPPDDCTNEQVSNNFESWDQQQQTDWLSNSENWDNPNFIKFAEQRLGPMETFNGKDVEIAKGYLEKVDYSQNSQAKDIGDNFFSQGSNINNVNPLVAERFFEAKWNAPFDFLNAGTLVYNKVNGFLTNDKMSINLNEYQKVDGKNADLTKIEAINGGFCIQTTQSSCVKSKIAAETKYNSQTGELVVKIGDNDNTFTPPAKDREALDVDIAADGTFRILGKAEGKVVVGQIPYTFTNREGTLLIKPNGNFDIENAELFTPNLYVDGQAEKVGKEVRLWDNSGGGTHGKKTVVIYTTNPENVGIISQGQSKQHGGTVTLHLDESWRNSQFKNAVNYRTQNSDQKRQEAANLIAASNDLGKNAEVYISHDTDGELVVSSLGKVQVGLYDGGLPSGFQRLTSQPTCIGTSGSAECELKFGQQYQVYLRGETQYGDEQYGQLVKDDRSKEWKIQGGEEGSKSGIQTLQKGASLSLKRTISTEINPEKDNDDLIVFKCFECTAGKVANVGKNIVVGQDLGVGLVNQLETYTYQMDVKADTNGKLIISPNPKALNKIADSLGTTSGIVLGNDVLIEAIDADGTKSTRGISRKDNQVLGYTKDSSGQQSWDSTGLRSTIGNSLIVVSPENKRSTETFLALYAAGQVDNALGIVFEQDPKLRKHLLRETGVDIYQLNNQKYLDKRNDLDDFRRQLADKGILLGVAGNCENDACNSALKNAGKTKDANAFLLTAATIRALELKNIELESQAEELKSEQKVDPKLTTQIKDNKNNIEGIRATRSKWQGDATTDAVTRETAFEEGLQAEQRQAEEVAFREELWDDQQKAKELGEIQDANQKSIEFLTNRKIELESKLEQLKIRSYGKPVWDAERDVRDVENDIAELEGLQTGSNIEVHQIANKYGDEDPAVAAGILIAGGDHQAGREIVKQALQENRVDIDGGQLLIINSLLAESKQKGGDRVLIRKAGIERGLVAELIIVGDREQIVRDVDLAIARHVLWQVEEKSKIDATAEAEAYTKVIEETESGVWGGIGNLLREGAGETVQAIAATSDLLLESPVPGAPPSILRTGVRFDDPSYMEMKEDERTANYEELYRRKVASRELVKELRENIRKLESGEIKTLEETLDVSKSKEITSEEGLSLGQAYASSSFYQELKSTALGNDPNPELTANRRLEEVRLFINERSGRAFEAREQLQKIASDFPDTRAGQTAKATLDDLDKRIGLFTVETLDKHGDLAIEVAGDVTNFFPFVSVLKVGGLAVKGTGAGIETISATIKATKAMQSIKTTAEVAQATKAGQFATQVGRGVVSAGQFVAEGTGKVVGGTFKVLGKTVEGKKSGLFRETIEEVSQQLAKDKDALTIAKTSGNEDDVIRLEQQVAKSQKYQRDLQEVQAASKIGTDNLFRERYIIRTKVMDDADVIVQAAAKELKERMTLTALKNSDKTAKLAEIAVEANRNKRILNGEIWDQRIVRKFQAAEEGARRIGNDVRAANIAADADNLRIQNEEIKNLGGQVIYVQEDGTLILDAVNVAPENSKLVQQSFQSIEENLRNNGFQIKRVRQESDNVVADIEVTALDAGRTTKEVLNEQTTLRVPASETIPVIRETAEPAVAKAAKLEERVDAAITGIPMKIIEEVPTTPGINEIIPSSPIESPIIRTPETSSLRVLSPERAEVLSPHIGDVIGETFNPNKNMELYDVADGGVSSLQGKPISEQKAALENFIAVGRQRGVDVSKFETTLKQFDEYEAYQERSFLGKFFRKEPAKPIIPEIITELRKEFFKPEGRVDDYISSMLSMQPSVGQTLEHTRRWSSNSHLFEPEILEETFGALEDIAQAHLLHGTSSKALPGLSRTKKLAPNNELKQLRIPPYGGELRYGVSSSGVNLEAVSTVAMESGGAELTYARESFNLEGWNPEKGRNGLVEAEAAYQELLQEGKMVQASILKSNIEITNNRLDYWDSLTATEKQFIEEPFPIVIGTEDTGLEKVLVSSSVSGETTIKGGIDLTDRKVVFFTDKEHIEILREHMSKVLGKDIKVHSLESLELSYRLRNTFSDGGLLYNGFQGSKALRNNPEYIAKLRQGYQEWLNLDFKITKPAVLREDIPISSVPASTVDSPVDTIKFMFQAESGKLAGKTDEEIENIFYDLYSKKTISGEVGQVKHKAYDKSQALVTELKSQLNRDAVHIDFGVVQSGWLGLQSVDELPQGNRVRLYINAKNAESSQQAMKEIAKELADRNLVFKIKSSRDEAEFAVRTDNTVLYIDASNKEEVEAILKRLDSALLDPETPLFTSRIKDGISWAEDPSAILSFGETRAIAFGEIYKKTGGSVDQNFDTIARKVLEENGIDPDQPWLSMESQLKTEKVVAEDLLETADLSSSCISCAIVGGAFSTGLGGASCCTRQEPLARLQPGESITLDLESRISEVSPSTQDFMKENGFTGKVTKPQFSPRIAAPKSLDETIRKNYPQSVVGDLGLFQASLMERSRIVVDPTTKQSVTETSDWYVKIIKGRRSPDDIDELDRRFIMGDNVRRDQSARFILQDPEFAKYTIVPEEEILVTPDNINLHASKAIEGYEVLGKKIDLGKLDRVMQTLTPNQRAELIESLDFQAAFNVWTRATDVELGIANGKVIRVDDEFTFTSFDILPTKYDPPQKYSKPDNLLKLSGNDLVLGPIDKNEFTIIKNGQEVIYEEFFERRFGKHIDALTSFSTEKSNLLRSHLLRAGYSNLEADLIINRLQQMTPEKMRSDIKKLILNDGYLIVREDGELLSHGEFNLYKLAKVPPENAPSPVQVAKSESSNIMAGPNPLSTSELLRQAVLKSPEEVQSAIPIEAIKTPGERPAAKEKGLLDRMYDSIAFWRSEAESS